MKLWRTAVLIIHGFAGGTYDAEYLDHHLELDARFDVYTFTLPGHDDNAVKKNKGSIWMKKAESEVEFLIDHGYHRIYLIGHSMGGVIASHLATKYKQVKKLVLVAPAFRFISFEEGSFKLLPALKKTPEIIEQYGFKMLTTRMIKLPASAVTEFIKLVKNNQKTPQSITVPTLIIQGTKDHIVPSQTAEYVYQNLSSKKKKIVYLEGITHDVFRETKALPATQLIYKFFKNKTSIKKFPPKI